MLSLVPPPALSFYLSHTLSALDQTDPDMTAAMATAAAAVKRSNVVVLGVPVDAQARGGGLYTLEQALVPIEPEAGATPEKALLLYAREGLARECPRRQWSCTPEKALVVNAREGRGRVRPRRPWSCMPEKAMRVCVCVCARVRSSRPGPRRPPGPPRRRTSERVGPCRLEFKLKRV